MKKKWLLLLLIVFLATILRFWKLGKIPPGFHRDEAFLGYNAYSILKTKRDINGNFLPLNFQSIVYAPGGYSYFAIPPIKIFGLNQFAVRFPSALFGSLSVLAIYFLTQEIFKGKFKTLALYSAFFLAISPWHINFSRTASENVLVVFFIILGIIFYLSWLEKKNWPRLLTSFICFGVTLYLYLASRSFLPLFLPILISVSFFRKKIDKKSQSLVWILFLLIIIFPSAWFLSSKNLSRWVQSISLFAGKETQLLIDQHIREDGVSSVSTLLARLFHNKAFGYFNQFLENYFSHFSFAFLFTDKGFPDRYRVPSMGLFYLFNLPFLLIGFWTLFKSGAREKIILFSWLLFSIIGSALTFHDVPNLQRTLIAVPVFSIVLAYGLHQIIIWTQKKKFFVTLAVLLTPFIFYNFAFYLHQYYVHFPLYQPWHRQDGYQELVKEVNKLLPNYQRAVITDRESAPTIFFLFFQQYDPATFQKETKNPLIQDFDRINFGNYEFLAEQCPLRLVKDKEKDTSFINGEEGVLYINSGLCDLLPKNVHEIKQIRRKDNSLVFRILEYQK